MEASVAVPHCIRHFSLFCALVLGMLSSPCPLHPHMPCYFVRVVCVAALLVSYQWSGGLEAVITFSCV